MQVRFEMRQPPPEKDMDGKELPGTPVEYVVIHSRRDGVDEVCRRATDKDRLRFKAEYAAFKAPPKPAPAPTPKDEAKAEFAPAAVAAKAAGSVEEKPEPTRFSFRPTKKRGE